MGRGTTVAWVAAIVVLVGAFFAVQTGAWAQVVADGEYDRATVKAVDANGTYLESVDVRIADTTSKQYLGLSNTSSLDRNEGMLFVYDQTGDHTYVMRRMDFPLDIIYVAGNGTVTRIHHAEVPEEHPGSSLQGYPGTGQYVLEVNRGWTNRTGFDVGDHLCVPDSV